MTFMGHLRGFAAFCAMALVCGAVAEAGAPQLKTQAPGYYRMMLGDFEVTALCDGTFPMKAGELLIGITPKQIEADLARSFLKDPVESSVNGFLINTGTKLILVDTGAGAFYGPTVGKLFANLEASGYKPEQVDEIYITHMHLDHVGGLIAGGKAVFPNATVRASQQEADHWLSQSKMDAAPKEAKEGFEHAMQALKPYVSAGKFKPFNGDVELVPGIRAVATPGHTPGHTVYQVSSKGETLILWGDLMHLGAIQFLDPSVALRFDSDTAAAIAARKKVFADAAEHGYWVGGAHLPFPGIGHLRAVPAGAGAAAGYTYVHANYTALVPGP
jgi:glyoxylase-like metal-dependent hydrolase (beta-lactamase superfamily II)